MSDIGNLGNNPFVSIVMPVYNEEAFIGRSLGSILEQTYPPELTEVIIADGMSTDNTRQIVEQIAAKSIILIEIVNNPKRIAPAGMNRAIERARGDIIVRVDGHCEVERDYVANCVKHLQSGIAEGVGGPIETIGETLQSQAIAVAMSSKFGVGGSAFRTIQDREMFVDTVAFPGYRKDIFARIGTFNEELVRNQDDEFNYRIRKAGGKILLSPEIRSRYYSRSTFKSLWKQYFQYGYWKVRVLQLHPKQMSLRQFMPLLFVGTLLILTAVSTFSHYGRLALLFTISLYILVALFAAITALRKIRVLSVPFIFLSFTILHFSYGFGFLSGLIAFRNKWRNHKKADLKPIS